MWVRKEEQDGEGRDAVKGMGMRLIAQRLAAESIPTRTGKPWSTATVSIILKNRVYVGTYTRYGFLVSGNHEPIISRSLFRKAQDALMVKQRQRRLSKSEDPVSAGWTAAMWRMRTWCTRIDAAADVASTGRYDGDEDLPVLRVLRMSVPTVRCKWETATGNARSGELMIWMGKCVRPSVGGYPRP